MLSSKTVETHHGPVLWEILHLLRLPWTDQTVKDIIIQITTESPQNDWRFHQTLLPWMGYNHQRFLLWPAFLSPQQPLLPTNSHWLLFPAHWRQAGIWQQFRGDLPLRYLWQLRLHVEGYLVREPRALDSDLLTRTRHVEQSGPLLSQL